MVLLSRKEAAARLNVCEDTLDKMRLGGHLAYIQRKPGGKVLIPESAVDEYIARAMHPAQPVARTMAGTYRRRRA